MRATCVKSVDAYRVRIISENRSLFWCNSLVNVQINYTAFKQNRERKTMCQFRRDVHSLVDIYRVNTTPEIYYVINNLYSAMITQVQFVERFTFDETIRTQNEY